MDATPGANAAGAGADRVPAAPAPACVDSYFAVTSNAVPMPNS